MVNGVICRSRVLANARGRTCTEAGWSEEPEVQPRCLIIIMYVHSIYPVAHPIRTIHRAVHVALIMWKPDSPSARDTASDPGPLCTGFSGDLRRWGRVSPLVRNSAACGLFFLRTLFLYFFRSPAAGLCTGSMHHFGSASAAQPPDGDVAGRTVQAKDN